jgi:hypothetical protein
MTLRSLTAAFLLTTICPLHAELKLDVERIDVKPKPEDEEIKVEFTFKNTGSKPVRVLNLESACSCLAANLDKAVYAPGETGKGDAEFKVSNFVGQHEKIIIVTTDDPEQKEWVIPFLLDVPAVVDIQPNNIQWWVGEEPTEKKVSVKFDKAHPMKITQITATRENVHFSHKEIVPNHEYEITVKPTSTKDITIGALKVETDSKIAKYARQMAFFSIVNQPKSRMDEPTAGQKEPK